MGYNMQSTEKREVGLPNVTYFILSLPISESVRLFPKSKYKLCSPTFCVFQLSHTCAASNSVVLEKEFLLFDLPLHVHAHVCCVSVTSSVGAAADVCVSRLIVQFAHVFAHV